MIVICLAALYLLLGTKLFYASIAELGGPEGYMEVLSANTDRPAVTYRFVFVYVVLLWPILLTASVIRYFAGRRRH